MPYTTGNKCTANEVKCSGSKWFANESQSQIVQQISACVMCVKHIRPANDPINNSSTTANVTVVSAMWADNMSVAAENKRLSWCWDSATCELLHARRPSAKLHILPIRQWSSSVDFAITGYYDQSRLQHASSQDTNLSCHVPISTFCCTKWLQSINVTDRYMDIMFIVPCVRVSVSVCMSDLCSAEAVYWCECPTLWLYCQCWRPLYMSHSGETPRDSHTLQIHIHTQIEHSWQHDIASRFDSYLR